MLDESISAVREFHRAKNIDFRERLRTTRLGYDALLGIVVNDMRNLSKRALNDFDPEAPEHHQQRDLRHLRIHLCTEEVCELLEALADGDEVKAIDALADLHYVMCGTAIAFDLPFSEAYAEVHRSNMSKASRTGTSNQNARLYDKGQTYTPPDLDGILAKHRSKHD